MEDMNPVAWLCEDLIFEGERSVIMKEDHAKARAALTDDWLVTPLYTLPAQAPAVKVKPLEWDNIGRCVGWSADREDTHLHTATALGRFYEVALGKDGWWAKWRGDYRARELPTPEAAKAAAQADYESRIFAALDLS